MRLFADLFDRLDATSSTNAKVAAMRDYFASAPPEDAAWGLFFLTGQRLKRVIGFPALRALVLEETKLAPWLLDECYFAVGDLAETIALLAPPRTAPPLDLPLHEWVETRVLPLARADEPTAKDAVRALWRSQPARELFLLHKMMTGELRVGVQKTLALRALSEATGVPREVLAHRVMGDEHPSADGYLRLVSLDETASHPGKPYPFCLAHPLEQAPETLGPRSDWLVEWKWDGIRAELIRRDGQTFLWSRGEEMVTERFPEIVLAAQRLPEGLVLDGEILAWANDRPLPFGALQKRIGRKRPPRSVLAKTPVVMMVFDVLEIDGEDVRELPLEERRRRLDALLTAHGSSVIRPSPIVEAESFEALAALRDDARERGVEGLMLKKRASRYLAGRKRGEWWKWKIDPLTVDCVLVYAQPGHGRRASLLTDYGFGVWNDEGALVPVAQAYSGLSDAEIAELDRWIREHTTDRRGPVRTVSPELVFEIGFEAIRRSTRHASGVAMRFPRILRWRRDKRPDQADTLASLVALLDAYAFEPPEEKKPKQLGLFGEE